MQYVRKLCCGSCYLASSGGKSAVKADYIWSKVIYLNSIGQQALMPKMVI